MTSKRELTAIMFTDIQGYTALMQKDEARALVIRNRHREVFERMHEKYDGEILQYFGDGTLSVFNSSVLAVRCAIELQQELLREPRVPLRVGIEMGDVIKTEEEIIGDGVNLASRIENLATPGSVLISRQIRDQIKNQGIKTQLLGKYQLKNVTDPTEIYAVIEEDLTIPTTDQIALKVNPISQVNSSGSTRLKIFAGLVIGILLVAYFFIAKPFSGGDEPVNSETLNTIEDEVFDRSIAVLPFVNMGNDPDQEYFSDGMMDEILNHLYKIGGLRIPSRTSSMSYKGVTDKTIREIGKELGVAHILEGSVQKSGAIVRIIVRLLDVETDSHVWSEDYKEEIKDVFNIQSKIAQQVAQELKTQISTEVKQRIETIPTKNPEAYNRFLQARYYLVQTMEREKAKELLDEAILLDSTFADAYALLGYYWLLRGSWTGDLEPDKLLDEALRLLNKAKDINKDYPITHAYLSMLHQWYRWDFETAGKAWETFFQLSPSNSMENSRYCDFLNASGRFQEAVEIVNKGVLNDPSYSSWGSGLSYYFNGQPDKAIQHYETAMNLFPNNNKLMGLGRVYVYTGKYEEAINLLKDFVDEGNRFPRPLGNLAIAYYHTDQQTRTDSILMELQQRSEQSPVGSPAFYVSMIYAQKGKIDLAFKWLQKAIQTREVEVYWLKVEPPFKPLHSDPRWQKMLEKVEFPE